MLAPEVGHRDGVRGVARLEREREPLAELRLGDAGERGGPLRPVVGVRHVVHHAGHGAVPRARLSGSWPAPASTNELSVG